jgi:hypothetical protein
MKLARNTWLTFHYEVGQLIRNPARFLRLKGGDR